MSTNLLYCLFAGVGVLFSFGIALWIFKREAMEN